MKAPAAPARSSRKQPSFAWQAALLAGILSLFSLVVSAAPLEAMEEVTITGHLLADDQPLNDAVLVVELSGNSCLRSELRANGQFKFRVPVGAKARLFFLKPGYLTKEVLVDTKNAMNTDRARSLNKKVEFDVVLDEELQHVGETYIGPVGHITFVNGTGLMRVRHDERMVALEQPIQAQPAALIND